MVATNGDVVAEVEVPDLGTPFARVCSNDPVCPASPSLSGIVGVPRAKDTAKPTPACTKKKSSVKKYSAKRRASSGAKQYMAGQCMWLYVELGVVSGGASVVVASPPIQVWSGPLFPLLERAGATRPVGSPLWIGQLVSLQLKTSLLQANEFVQATIAKANESAAGKQPSSTAAMGEMVVEGSG
ncbi:hypothetical protein D1007_53491 [Hordeum vulgare]|nr:hypothetical protein D1007_53491 [Hordeum vulgare]